MDSLLRDYLPILVLLAVAVGLGLVLILAAALIAVRNPDPEKLSAYECGFNAFDDARMKFDVRFYLVSILFIIFDLEVGDVLDFSAIDANGAARGNTAFINVGQNAFTGIGQLRMYEAEGTWLVEGNTTGTLDADFQVELRNWTGQPFTDLVL